MILTTPCPLESNHEIQDFSCREDELNFWLKQRAYANQQSGASRTYVVCEGHRVVGYYCLSTGALFHTMAPGKVRRNMPEPIPVILIGRLAVDRRYEGLGIGKGLLKDAVLRALQVAETVGVRALLVHAISKEVKRFYEGWGFHSTSVSPMTLAITLEDAKKALIKPK